MPQPLRSILTSDIAARVLLPRGHPETRRRVEAPRFRPTAAFPTIPPATALLSLAHPENSVVSSPGARRCQGGIGGGGGVTWGWRIGWAYRIGGVVNARKGRTSVKRRQAKSMNWCTFDVLEGIAVMVVCHGRVKPGHVLWSVRASLDGVFQHHIASAVKGRKFFCNYYI